MTDGPFAEAKEVLGGYWMIQVKSKEEAIEWASRCPVLGERSHRSAPGAGIRDFPADVQHAAAGFAEMKGSTAGSRARRARRTERRCDRR